MLRVLGSSRLTLVLVGVLSSLYILNPLFRVPNSAPGVRTGSTGQAVLAKVTSVPDVQSPLQTTSSPTVKNAQASSTTPNIQTAVAISTTSSNQSVAAEPPKANKGPSTPSICAKEKLLGLVHTSTCLSI